VIDRTDLFALSFAKNMVLFGLLIALAAHSELKVEKS
jgi:hypothetical protein